MATPRTETEVQREECPKHGMVDAVISFIRLANGTKQVTGKECPKDGGHPFW